MSLFQFERDGSDEALVSVLDSSDVTSVRARSAEILGNLSADRKEVPVDVVDALVEAAEGDQDEQVRASAVDALDRCGPAALQRLISKLSDRDFEAAADWVAAEEFATYLEADRPELRMAAAAGLGSVGTPEVVDGLVRRLEDPDRRVRTRAARACGRIGDPHAVEALANRLDVDDGKTRPAAANALGEIGSETALNALLPYADDDDESIRRIVVDALGRFDSLDPVDALVAALDDDYETVRRTAIFSLVEILSNAPTDRSHEVRASMVDELAAARAGEVVPLLVEVLTESSQAPQRRNAAWLLGRVVDANSPYEPTARPVLVDALDDDDATTAQFAATSLVELGGEALERSLLDTVCDLEASPGSRSKALFVLGRVGSETARSELGVFVDATDDDDLRGQAFTALSKLGGMGGGDLG